jgi:hypothetical protein
MTRDFSERVMVLEDALRGLLDPFRVAADEGWCHWCGLILNHRPDCAYLQAQAALKGDR